MGNYFPNGRKMYACCYLHTGRATEFFIGEHLEIIKLAHADERYRCSCGRLADFLFREPLPEGSSEN